MSFKIPKAPKVPKLDPALLKRIPEIVNNIAFKIIQGTPPGEAVESEIKDRIKDAVMNEIQPMLGGNQLVVKLADKAVEKAIDKMWGKIKDTLMKKLAGEDIGEMPTVSQAPATQYQPNQYQQQTYYPEQSYKKNKNNNSAFGSISIVIGIVLTLFLMIGIMSNFSTSSFTNVAYASFIIFPFIGLIYGIIGVSKDRKKVMGIIGLVIDALFFIGVLALFF